MLFSLCIVLLAIATACLPLIVRYGSRYTFSMSLGRASAWLPVLAGLLLVISTRLPDVHISSQTSTFQQHFVGGGLYTVCLYFYAKQLFQWRLFWPIDIAAMFAWVSAFGVANKLIEFMFLQLGLAHVDTGDAYWDLLANTLGDFTGYFILFKFFRLSKASTIK